MSIVLNKIDVLVAHKIKLIDQDQADLRSKYDSKMSNLEKQFFRMQSEFRKNVMEIETRIQSLIAAQASNVSDLHSF